MPTWLQQIRPKQWIKNTFVLAAPLFSTSSVSWPRALFASVLFTVISGTVYIFNDILDLERDRDHPLKCQRPLASGRITLRQAKIEGTLLLGVGILGGLSLSLSFLGIIIIYLLINLAYSLKLKKMPIADVICIALGFVLRALAGAVAVGISVTFWFLFCIFGLSLFLALRKREYDPNSRYQVTWIPWASRTIRVATGLGYTLFSLQSGLWLTIPLAWMGLFRYTGGSAEEALTKDKILGGVVVIFGCLVILERAKIL